MTQPNDYTFTRYLAAKKSVDDRALNAYVWGKLAEWLSYFPVNRPLRVLELGAGIGTMVERLLERRLLRRVEYTAIDNQPENLRGAMSRLQGWGDRHGMRVESTPDSIRLESDPSHVLVSFEITDVAEFVTRQATSPGWDLLIAHAFLDLVDIPLLMPNLLRRIEPGGVFYFSLNFDGLTLLEPAIDPPLDDLIQELYHRNMDARCLDGKPSGDSRTGRHLFTHLKNAGAQIWAAGASDWVVHAQPGGYPEDEAYFLHFIIHTIYQALRGHPDLEAARFDAWVAERHAQIDCRELVYIAHQLDFIGAKNG
jgi:SAM-dependent methyltransferase